MRIGELAEQARVNPKTIRFYETIGLLPEPTRTSGNYRDYTADDLGRLRFIKTAQRLGFSLDEIGEILRFAERSEPPCGYVRERLQAEVAAIDARIRDLRVLRAELLDLQAKAAQLPPAADGYCPIIHSKENTADIRSGGSRQ
ncbi:MAG TPA: heavy metal-responsive transcriptional regulator [Jatrophihabitantaceae bacterium]|nr:heavy metal-responsive transcriptional regulator [Jatrophihabitantaceae bacterium]